MPLPTMEIVESDTGQRPNSELGPDLSTGKVLDIGREEHRNGTITSSPPPKVGCGRTVTEGCNPLESKHGFDREIICSGSFLLLPNELGL